ncbi:sensor histidine kinase [Rufibacter glacialis]|uniref:histidine kinase n=1 Tax=Rufibacter glacialis TaxID=1259555 RepID=A0A5M8QNR6_9BACT|nr:HAMP domain-containing sensor histidine kinase [Rufibacter glacialis]KAA6437785.1 HAMP domain-containing histidine kinase [Rufibacter glacialis]GGK56245.1 two-component sensor histidine kinase [Rufibacter glacialis]
MSRQKIQVILVLACGALVALLSVQLVWLQKAYNAQERAFNHSVQIALTSVSDQLLAQTGKPQLTPAKPIQQVASNFFLAELNAPVDPAQASQLLRQELAKRQLQERYEFGLYNSLDDTLMFGQYIAAPQQAANPAPEQIIRHERAGAVPLYNLAVVFPGKTAFILREMEFWWYSTGALLVVVLFFTYTLVQILREKRLTELKTDFINNLTHELQTPITNIGLASDVLRKRAETLSPDRLTRYHDLIYAENERLRAQVERVLQMATLENRDLALRKETVDLHALLQETGQNLQPRLQERAGHLRLNLQATNPLVHADGLHVANALYSLLDNAEKYSTQAPEIDVSTQDTEQGIQISIRDRGIGIRQECQKFLFDKFYRVPNGNVHNVRGFGLGLSYVKTIMEAHHGQVTVESTEQQGTCFRLVLPVAKGAF